jgi:hypothetical protein
MSLSSTPVRFAGIPEIQQNLIKAGLCIQQARNVNPADESAAANHLAGMADAFTQAAVTDPEFPVYVNSPDHFNRQLVLVDFDASPGGKTLLHLSGVALSVKDIFNPLDSLHHDLSSPNANKELQRNREALPVDAWELADTIKRVFSRLNQFSALQQQIPQDRVHHLTNAKGPFLQSLLSWHNTKESQ